MRISEIYISLQGEGAFSGEPTVFVRLTGCNLRCWFCDSRHTSWSPEGTVREWREVAEEVLDLDVRHVDITGGEPLLQPDVVPLSQALREAGRFVTVETAGTVDRAVSVDLMSISPKRPNSSPRHPVWSARHDARRDAPAVIERWLRDYVCQFKFVIDTAADIADVVEYHGRYRMESAQIWLMPQARSREELDEKSAWIRAEADRLGYCFSPRLQIELFGNVRGK